MLPPYELEKREFKKSVKGYNIADVDEHLEFIVDKYTELYRAYNELEQKLSEASAELETYKRNEDAIRRALVYAQNTKKKIIDDANKRSDMILKSAKENCDRIISEFKEQVKEERSTLAMLKAQVEEFKQRIFSQYQRHIEYLEEISPDNDTRAEWLLPESEYMSKVLAQVVLDVENAEGETNGTDGANVSEEDTDIASFDTTLDTLVADRTAFDVPFVDEEPVANEKAVSDEEPVANEKAVADEEPASDQPEADDVNNATIQMDRNASLDLLFTSQSKGAVDDEESENDGEPENDPGAETIKFEIK